jgi:hypothetical protein
MSNEITLQLDMMIFGDSSNHQFISKVLGYIFPAVD